MTETLPGRAIADPPLRQELTALGSGDSRSLVASLRRMIAVELNTEASDLGAEDRRELARELATGRFRKIDSELVAAGERPVAPTVQMRITQEVLDALFGLGRLQPLVDDPRIENIDVNGSDQVWVTYADGSKSAMEPIADNDEELVEVLRNAAARFGLSERRFDLANPELDLRLPDGSRLSALMSVVRRPCVSIRRHRFMDLTMNDLVSLGTVDRQVASFLTAAVRARKNIVVAGAMNSGKTTMIRALAAAIPARERIVTIEQAFELGLDTMPERHPDLVALEAREPNMEGVGSIGMAALVKRALRMNADRVIVGEVLGDEVIPMLNAMSQGRSGSMCTVHADSSSGVFRRLASYAVQAQERLPLEATTLLVAGAIHFVVFVDVGAPVGPESSARWEPLSAGGTGGRTSFLPIRRNRFVSSVREVVDADGMQVVSNEIFRPGRDRRAHPAAPIRSETLEELLDHGYEPASVVESGSWT
jgi:pilus assembly protein CpaF